MKLPIHELKNLISKIMSKKSILILPSIVLLILVNACTPLPTGGPVSANVIYKVHNKTIKIDADGINYPNNILGIDVNNDSINDVFITREEYTSLYLSVSFGTNTKTAEVSDSIRYMKVFRLNETIGNVIYWQSFLQNILYYTYNNTVQSYNNASECILGLEIQNGINYNYGWVKLYLNKLTKEVTVIESAYNTVPNQSILAGKK